MKFQELSQTEMKEVNGGLLGLGNSSDSASSGALLGSLNIGFSNESVDDDGSSEKTQFGTSADLGGIFNSIVS